MPLISAQSHSGIEPHPKFELVHLAVNQTNNLKLMVCMFVSNLSMLKIVYGPLEHYSVSQSLKLELYPNQKQVFKIKLRGYIEADMVYEFEKKNSNLYY